MEAVFGDRDLARLICVRLRDKDVDRLMRSSKLMAAAASTAPIWDEIVGSLERGAPPEPPDMSDPRPFRPMPERGDAYMACVAATAGSTIIEIRMSGRSTAAWAALDSPPWDPLRALVQGHTVVGGAPQNPPWCDLRCSELLRGPTGRPRLPPQNPWTPCSTTLRTNSVRQMMKLGEFTCGRGCGEIRFSVPFSDASSFLGPWWCSVRLMRPLHYAQDMKAE